MKREAWWIVIINLSGVSGPIRCYRKSTHHEGYPVLWDRSGNHDCSKVAGVVEIGGEGSHCIQYQTPVKREAEMFALGARELAKRLTYYLSP